MELTKEIYTTREAASLIQLRPEAIRTAILKGQLKANKFGTSYAITRDDLREYLEYRKARNL